MSMKSRLPTTISPTRAGRRRIPSHGIVGRRLPRERHPAHPGEMLIAAFTAGAIVCPNHDSPPADPAVFPHRLSKRRIPASLSIDTINPLPRLAQEQHPDFDSVPPAPAIGRMSFDRRTFR